MRHSLFSYFFKFTGIVVALFILNLILRGLYLGYWDNRVARYCLQEGGTTVFRRVELTESEAVEYGLLRFGRVELVTQRNPGADVDQPRFYLERTRDEIKSRNPTVLRITSQAIDRIDGEILGEFVSFVRVAGGPILSIMEQQGFTCNRVEGFEYDLEDQIFSITD